MKKIKYKYPLVLVKWEDAIYRSEDADAHDKMTPEIILTAGWLLEETEEHITICQEYSEADTWVRHRSCIPLAMVEDIRKIK